MAKAAPRRDLIFEHAEDPALRVEETCTTNSPLTNVE